MKIIKTNGKYSIELTKEEYVMVAEKANREVDLDWYKYDVEEIKANRDEVIRIDDSMITEVNGPENKQGFWMWSNEFRELIFVYGDLSDEEYDSDNFEKEVTIINDYRLHLYHNDSYCGEQTIKALSKGDAFRKFQENPVNRQYEVTDLYKVQ